MDFPRFLFWQFNSQIWIDQECPKHSLLPRSETAVDRSGYKEFRTNQAVKGLPIRSAEGALDSLICSEKRWPLRSTATRAV
jgi:hypothetical protein